MKLFCFALLACVAALHAQDALELSLSSRSELDAFTSSSVSSHFQSSFSSSLSLSDLWDVSSSSSTSTSHSGLGDECICSEYVANDEKVCLYVDDVEAPTRDIDDDDDDTSNDDDDNWSAWRPVVREGPCDQACVCERDGAPSESSLSSSSSEGSNRYFGGGGRCQFAVEHAQVCDYCKDASEHDPHCVCITQNLVGDTDFGANAALTGGICVAVASGVVIDGHDIDLTDNDDAFIIAGHYVDTDGTSDAAISLGDGDDIFVAVSGASFQEELMVIGEGGKDRFVVHDRAVAPILSGSTDADRYYVARGGFAQSIVADHQSLIVVSGSVSVISVEGGEVFLTGCAYVGTLEGVDGSNEMHLLIVAATGSAIGTPDDAVDAGLRVVADAQLAHVYLRLAGAIQGMYVHIYDTSFGSGNAGELRDIDAVIYSSASIESEGSDLNSLAFYGLTAEGNVNALIHAHASFGYFGVESSYGDINFVTGDYVVFYVLKIKSDEGENFTLDKTATNVVLGNYVAIVGEDIDDGAFNLEHYHGGDLHIQVGANARINSFYLEGSYADDMKTVFGPNFYSPSVEIVDFDGADTTSQIVFQSGAVVGNVDVHTYTNTAVIFSGARVNSFYHDITDEPDDMTFDHYLLCGSQVVYAAVSLDFDDGRLYVAPGSSIKDAFYGTFAVNPDRKRSAEPAAHVKRFDNPDITQIDFVQVNGPHIWDSLIGSYGIVGCCYDTESDPARISCPIGPARCLDQEEGKRRRSVHGLDAVEEALAHGDAADTYGEYAELLSSIAESARSLDASIDAAVADLKPEAMERRAAPKSPSKNSAKQVPHTTRGEHRQHSSRSTRIVKASRDGAPLDASTKALNALNMLTKLKY